MFRALILSFSLLFILHQPLHAAGGNGPLWEGRAENAVPEDEKFEPSLVPAVLGGAAGGVRGGRGGGRGAVSWVSNWESSGSVSQPDPLQAGGCWAASALLSGLLRVLGAAIISS